jgi:heptaprenylglyceryl phosphate synthase
MHCHHGTVLHQRQLGTCDQAGRSQPTAAVATNADATVSHPAAWAETGSRTPIQQSAQHKAGGASTDTLYDAVIIGGGMGGLTTATQMAAKGAKVLVLEKCDTGPFTISNGVRGSANDSPPRYFW